MEDVHVGGHELGAEGVVIHSKALLARLKYNDVIGEQTFDMYDTVISSNAGSLLQRSVLPRDSPG